MGFCLSLEQPGLPPDPFAADEEGRVINRFTLTGRYDTAFSSLLLCWMIEHDLPTSSETDINNWFIAHMNNGIEILAARIKSLVDISDILPKPQQGDLPYES
jgi:DNA sulfur modification protein DndE